MTTTSATTGESRLDAFSNALDVLQDGFVILDGEWRFVYLNQTAARSIGYGPTEPVGAVVWERFPSLLGTEVERAYRRAMKERVPLAIEMKGPITRRWYRVGISPTQVGICVLWTDITERKRIEEELRHSEERFAAIHDRAPFAIALTSLPDHRLVSVNDAFVELFGFAREELLGRTSVELGIADADSRAAVKETMEGRAVVREHEVAAATRAGETRTLAINLDRVGLGGSDYLLTTIRDVTDRKRAETLLKDRLAAQEQLAKFAASVPGAICTFRQRPDGSPCMPFSAEALEDLYGLSRAELALDMSPCLARIHPEDRERVRVSIESSAKAMTPWHAEYRYDHPRKGMRWIEGWSLPSRDPDGGTTWHGYVIDVSDARRAQQALVDAERRATARAAELQAVLDTVPAAVWMTRDPRGDVITGNRFAEEILGLPRGQNMSLSAPEVGRPTNYHLRRGGVLLPEDDLPIQRSARQGLELREVEFDVAFEDGSVRHLVGNATPLREGDRVTGSVGAFIDITDRKRAEDELRRSEEKLRLAKEAARMGWWDWDLASGELVWSARCKALYDVPAEVTMTHERFLAAIQEEDRAGVRSAIETALATRAPFETEMRVPLSDGGLRWIESRGLAYYDDAGRPIRMTGMALDVTARRRAEEELRAEARRKDQFLAVLSHELRNPLAPIQNSVHLLERIAPESEVAARARGVLRRQADHLARLVDDLLDVTRIARGKIALRVERIDLRDVARRTADDLQSLFEGAGVALRVEHPGHPVWIDADPIRMAQVIGNLLNNGAKFTPREGTVLLVVSTDGAHAEVRVVDTGPGIAIDQQTRLFEPFAQAEQGLARTRGGLGLGLAIVKGMVELHGGSVRAKNAGPSEGAEFVITLPLAAPAAPARGPRAEGRGSPRDVLIIEDNPDAGTSLCDLLALEGHHVRVASDGRLGLAMAHERIPDVVLCDIGLPDIDGYQVASAMRADPALKRVRLVALTGYAQPEDVARAVAAGFDAHVSKPPAPLVLSRAIG